MASDKKISGEDFHISWVVRVRTTEVVEIQHRSIRARMDKENILGALSDLD
jgi:hypothetical protein